MKLALQIRAQTIEADIDLEDLLSALQDADRADLWIERLKTCLRSFRLTPRSMLKTMSPSARKIIVEALRAQADRIEAIDAQPIEPANESTHESQD